MSNKFGHSCTNHAYRYFLEWKRILTFYIQLKCLWLVKVCVIFKFILTYSIIINTFNITVRFFLGNDCEITNRCILETDYVFVAILSRNFVSVYTSNLFC